MSGTVEHKKARAKAREEEEEAEEERRTIIEFSTERTRLIRDFCAKISTKIIFIINLLRRMVAKMTVFSPYVYSRMYISILVIRTQEAVFAKIIRSTLKYAYTFLFSPRSRAAFITFIC